MSDEFKMVFPSRDAAISSLCHKVFGAHAVFDESKIDEGNSPAECPTQEMEGEPQPERPGEPSDFAGAICGYRDLERQLAEVHEQRDALAKAGKILADEYLDRRSQWGSEHLWTKHEDMEAVNAALITVERSGA